MRKLDTFAAFNAVLFLLLCVFRYHARFVAYRGAEHIEEFFIYAGAILVGIGVLWWRFRTRSFDGALLVLLEAGILMHFAGAFVPIEGGRLYDAHLLGVRYDKYVHLVNAFAVTALVMRLFRVQGIAASATNGVFLVLVVLGLGALVEIVEYLVVLTVPNNGVGDYDNNMQDLIANVAGVSAWLAFRTARARRPFDPMAWPGRTSVAPPRCGAAPVPQAGRTVVR